MPIACILWILEFRMEYAFTDVDGQDGILLSGRCTYEDGSSFTACWVIVISRRVRWFRWICVS